MDATVNLCERVASFPRSLVPKLCLGTHVSKLRFEPKKTHDSIHAFNDAPAGPGSRNRVSQACVPKQSLGTRGVRVVPFVTTPTYRLPSTRLSSSVTRRNTLPQSSAFGWRNRRMVGYQGVSSRPTIQRKSWTNVSTVQTGLPRDPAR